MISNSPNQKKKILLRLPRVKGFAIDNITVLHNNDETESIKSSLSNPQKFSNARKSSFPSTPSNQITWKLNSNTAEKHSSPLPESDFSSMVSIVTSKSLQKYIKYRRSSFRPTKIFNKLNLSQCDSCSITKTLLRNLSAKSSKISPSFISPSANRIKRSLFIIQGTLLTRLPKK